MEANAFYVSVRYQPCYLLCSSVILLFLFLFLVTECPGGASNPCNGRGRCQGQREGEQCQCNPAFTGVSCELCAAEDAYGPNCDQGRDIMGVFD